jgi:phosphoserine phosphatase
MSLFYLTCIASTTPLLAAHIAQFLSLLDRMGLQVAGHPSILAAEKAIDIPLYHAPHFDQLQQLRAAFMAQKFDIICSNAVNRRKNLLLADMDSTIVQGETLDELAALSGVGDQVAEITRRAMNGELDFEQALDARVAMLKGKEASLLETILSHTHLTAGARILVQTMKAHGAFCVLISGGFTYFTQSIATQCGFDVHFGNDLQIEQGILTGKVNRPLVSKETKFEKFNEFVAQCGIERSQTLTTGDGANDLLMLCAAEENGGLGIGFHPKPKVRESVRNVILHGDLTALLYAQGYRKEEFSA